MPIAVIVEDDSQMARQLANEIAAIDLLEVRYIGLDEALHKLQQHELDSVFLLRDGYETAVLSNDRNWLIRGYSSNRSFAYQAVAETVMSIAQQDMSRSKAASVIQQLYKEYGMEDVWNYDAIIQRSMERQENESLLQTHFTYGRQSSTSEETPMRLLNNRGVWAFFTIISAFFLFDWMIKESRPAMQIRWLYTSISFKRHALRMFVFYTALTILSDVLSIFVFTFFLSEPVTSSLLLPLLTFRTTLNLLAFLLAIVFRQVLPYTMTGIAIALFLTVTGGAVIPLDGLTRKWEWVEAISPVQSLLSMTVPVVWMIGLIATLAVWFYGRGRRVA
ncbi:hypothetical protein SLU01_23880 [Sporosarcina luteola]|uniref:ABC-2 type transporter transmembrane domain-containing protein n=1 Tax=Sporosarcina luteola TaxID=582850 RepID=A0A511Z9G2_9BACL|nr:hypothetical protein SLU01_23880 [Sporosarcina luteola]